MTNIETLDLVALTSVTGAGPQRRATPPADRPSSADRTTVRSNIGLTYRGAQIGIQTDVDTTRQAYQACLSTALQMRATPEQTLAMCGRPPGSR